MRCVTVRRVADNLLICFGPDNGMYDPTCIDPAYVKSVEPDYDAVFAEWMARPPRTNAEKDAELQMFLDSAGGHVVKAIATVLIQKGVVTLAELKSAYRSIAS